MKVGVAPEFLSGIVDLADDSTTVFNGPVLLRGIHVVSTLSAQDVLILDGVTQIGTIPGSAGPGTWVEFGDQRLDTSLIIDPDDAATGDISVVYKPNHEGLAGSGAGLP